MMVHGAGEVKCRVGLLLGRWDRSQEDMYAPPPLFLSLSLSLSAWVCLCMYLDNSLDNQHSAINHLINNVSVNRSIN